MSTRADRRSANEIRPLGLTQSLLTRADGSAKFSFGNVTALASVTGPSEVRIRDELVDRATLEINVKPLRGLSGPASKSTETLLISLFSPIILLHLHARSLIQISIQTLQSPSTNFSKAFSTDLTSLPPTLDSESTPSASNSSSSITEPSSPIEGLGLGTSEKAAQINATMLALIDSGIECKGLILSVAIAFLSSTGEMVLDPTPLEELNAKSTHLFSFSFGMAGNGGIGGVCVGIDSLGRFSEDELFDAQDLARNAIRGVNAFVRKSIETKYSSIEGGGRGGKAKKQKVVKEVDEMDVEEEE